MRRNSIIFAILLHALIVKTRSEEIALPVAPEIAAQHLLTRVEPTYPPLAKSAETQGTVRFGLTITESGSVADLVLISGHVLLAGAAYAAVRQWTYKPFIKEGKPIAVKTTVEVDFSLDLPRTAVPVDARRAADVPCAIRQSSHPTSPVKRGYIDENDCVHVVYADNQDVEVPKEKDQVSAESLQVAPDNRIVGWLVDTPNCCTSYPIPTTLVVYRHGRIVQRISDGMMIYKWKYVARGGRIAVSSGTVHGMNGIHLTLYDSNSGKRLRTWDGEYDDVPPRWGASLAR